MNNITTARVGDPLLLRFEILDEKSPYDIFIHSLRATDGSSVSNIDLIGNDGCPKDISIMGPLQRSKGAKVYETQFEAFKFPTSDWVQFMASVSPCLQECLPTHCLSMGNDGSKLVAYSYGRRRRKRDTTDELTLTQSIRIVDVLEFNDSGGSNRPLDLAGRKLTDDDPIYNTLGKK